MNFQDGLHNKAKIIDDYLNLYLTQHENSFELKLHESMRYSLLAGGKRIRPVLLMTIGELFGSKQEQLIDYACCIEMIHTYSLIHDDLPAMDDDDLRRGIATNHIVFGEAMAILAGDGLLNFAFETMSRIALSQGMNHVKAMHEISKAAGHQGMIGGQVADILSENQMGDLSILTYIQEKKTGALITTSIVAGGMIAGVDDETIEKLRLLGTLVGTAFQIQDDILDIESTEQTLGKPIGSDEKNSKLTYPSLCGLEASKARVQSLIQEAVQIIESFEGDVTFLKALIEYLCYRKN